MLSRIVRLRLPRAPLPLLPRPGVPVLGWPLPPRVLPARAWLLILIRPSVVLAIRHSSALPGGNVQGRLNTASPPSGRIVARGSARPVRK
jgi:hypothetical protein